MKIENFTDDRLRGPGVRQPPLESARGQQRKLNGKRRDRNRKPAAHTDPAHANERGGYLEQ